MVTTLHGGVRTGGGESSRLESSTVHLLLFRDDCSVASPFSRMSRFFGDFFRQVSRDSTRLKLA